MKRTDTAAESGQLPSRRIRRSLVVAATCALVVDACLPLDDLDSHSSVDGAEAGTGELNPEAAVRDASSGPEGSPASSAPAEAASSEGEPAAVDDDARDEGLGMLPVLTEGVAAGAADEETAVEGTADDIAVAEASAAEGSAADEGAADEGAADEGAVEEGAVEEGAADEGAADESAADEGAADAAETDPIPVACDAPGEFSGPLGVGCYFLSDQAVDWLEAQARCVSWGGTLARVNSAEEDALLGARAEENFWIGLNDRVVEGQMVWDGGGFLRGFRDWAVAQPDDNGQNEDCVERDGDGIGWNDLPCSELRLFACER